jgi:hypothetical protein
MDYHPVATRPGALESKILVAIQNELALPELEGTP